MDSKYARPPPHPNEYNSDNTLSNKINSLARSIKGMSLKSKKGSDSSLAHQTVSYNHNLMHIQDNLTRDIHNSSEANYLDERATFNYRIQTPSILSRNSDEMKRHDPFSSSNTSKNSSSNYHHVLQHSNLSNEESMYYQHHLLQQDQSSNFNSNNRSQYNSQIDIKPNYLSQNRSSDVASIYSDSAADSNLYFNSNPKTSAYYRRNSGERDVNLINVNKNEIKLVYLQTANAMGKRAKSKDADTSHTSFPPTGAKFVGTGNEFVVDKSRSIQKDFTQLTSVSSINPKNSSSSSNPTRVFEKEYKIKYYPGVLHRKYSESAAAKKQLSDSGSSASGLEFFSPTIQPVPFIGGQPDSADSSKPPSSVYESLERDPQTPQMSSTAVDNSNKLEQAAFYQGKYAKYIVSTTETNKVNTNTDTNPSFYSNSNARAKNKSFSSHDKNNTRINSPGRYSNDAVTMPENRTGDPYLTNDNFKYRSKSTGTPELSTLQANRQPASSTSTNATRNLDSTITYSKETDINTNKQTNDNIKSEAKNENDFNIATNTNRNINADTINNHSSIATYENAHPALTAMRSYKRSGGKIKSTNQSVDATSGKTSDLAHYGANVNLEHLAKYLESNKTRQPGGSQTPQGKPETEPKPQASTPHQSVYDFISNSVKKTSSKPKLSTSRETSVIQLFGTEKDAQMDSLIQVPKPTHQQQPQKLQILKVQEIGVVQTQTQEQDSSSISVLNLPTHSTSTSETLSSTGQNTKINSAGDLGKVKYTEILTTGSKTLPSIKEGQDKLSTTSKSVSTETQTAADEQAPIADEKNKPAKKDSKEPNNLVSYVPTLQYAQEKRPKKKRFRNVRIQCALSEKFPDTKASLGEIQAKDQKILELQKQIESITQAHAEEIEVYSNRLSETINLNALLSEELSITQDLLKSGNSENYDNVGDSNSDYKQKALETEKELETYTKVSQNKVDELLEMVAYLSSKCEHYQDLLENGERENDIQTSSEKSTTQTENTLEASQETNVPYDFYHGAAKIAKGFSSRLSEVNFIENVYKSIADNKKQISRDIEFFGVINRIETEIDDTSTAIEVRLERLTKDIKSFHREAYGVGILGFETQFQNRALYYNAENRPTEDFIAQKILKEQNRRSTVFNTTPTRSLGIPQSEPETLGLLFANRNSKSRPSIPKALIQKPKRHTMAPNASNSLRLNSNRKIDFDNLKSIAEAQLDSDNNEPEPVDEDISPSSDSLDRPQPNTEYLLEEKSLNQSGLHDNISPLPHPTNSPNSNQDVSEFSDNIPTKSNDSNAAFQFEKLEGSAVSDPSCMTGIKSPKNLSDTATPELHYAAATASPSLAHSVTEGASGTYKPSPSLSESSQSTLVTQLKMLVKEDSSEDAQSSASPSFGNEESEKSQLNGQTECRTSSSSKLNIESYQTRVSAELQHQKHRSTESQFAPSRSGSIVDHKAPSPSNAFSDLSNSVSPSNIDSLLEEALGNLRQSNLYTSMRNEKKAKDSFSRALSEDQFEELRTSSRASREYRKIKLDHLDSNNFNASGYDRSALKSARNGEMPRSSSSIGFSSPESYIPLIKKESTLPLSSSFTTQKSPSLRNSTISDKPSLTGEELLESLKMGVIINPPRKKSFAQNKLSPHTSYKLRVSPQPQLQTAPESLEKL